MEIKHLYNSPWVFIREGNKGNKENTVVLKQNWYLNQSSLYWSFLLSHLKLQIKNAKSQMYLYNITTFLNLRKQKPNHCFAGLWWRISLAQTLPLGAGFFLVACLILFHRNSYMPVLYKYILSYCVILFITGEQQESWGRKHLWDEKRYREDLRVSRGVRRALDIRGTGLVHRDVAESTLWKNLAYFSLLDIIWNNLLWVQNVEI